MASYTPTNWVNGETPANATNMNKIEQAIKAVYDMIYPIGSIYMSVNSANPSTLFGGTWEAWGAGKVPVGIDTNDGDFDTVEETGGTKSTNLEYAPNENYGLQLNSYGYSNRYIVGKSDLSQAIFEKGNLQPYIVCYMWKRTA